ncbi:MAG: hypothetical protein MUF25_18565, partial [Pirellulaceae bacterium]|nr:hypothetical protein [Pirellulaceae bacterium]
MNRGGAAQVSYDTLETLTANATSSPNSVIIRSTLSSTPVTVYGNGGDDTFDVGNASNSLDDIQSAVTIYGGGGTGDKINVNDSGDGGLNGYTLNGTSLTRTSLTPPATVTVNYEATLEELVLNADGISTVAGPVTTGNVIGVTASANTKFTIHGNNPAASAVPGDTLNYTGPATVTKTLGGTGSGTISDPGATVKDVVYDGIETLTATGTFDDALTLPADGNPNLVIVKLDTTATYVEIYLDTNSNTPGDEVLYSRQLMADFNSLTVTGGADDDRLVIDGVNGLPVFAGVVPGTVDNDTDNLSISNEPNLLFHGNAGNDSILFQNLPGGYDQTYAMGEGDGGGKGANTAEGEILTVAGAAQLNIYFTGLEPLLTTSPGGGTLKVYGDATANTISVVDSPVAGYTRVQETAGPFESFDFVPGAFTNLEIYGMGGADRVELQSLDAGEDGGAGELATIRLDGDTDTNTDASADVVAVRSTSNLPGTAIVQMFGGAGVDGFLLDSDADGQFAAGTVDNIQAPIQVAPAGDEGGGDELYVIDTSAAGKTVAVTNNSIDGITGLGAGTDISYTAAVTTVKVFTSNLPDTVNVNSTAAGTTYHLATQGGDDRINISSDTSIPSLTAGNLDTILGQVRIDTGGSTNDILALSDYNDTDSDTYTVVKTGSGQETAFRFNGGALLNDVLYNAAITSFGSLNTINAANAGTLENLYVIGSSFGGSIYNVQHTSATSTNWFDDGDGGGSGDSQFNIQADALQPGSANIFVGYAGSDDFNLNFADGASIPSTAGLFIDGLWPDSTLTGRDRVDIDTSADTGGPRNVTITYDNAGSGDVTIAGLGSSGAINIDRVEFVTYAGDAANNDDDVRVNATTAADTMLVDPTGANSANVYRGGTLPAPLGVADAQPGPDLQLGAIDSLLVNGDTPSTPLPADTLITDLSGITGAVLELIPTKIGFVGAWNFGAGLLGYSFINFETVDVTFDGTGGPYDVHVRADLSTDAVLNAAPFFLGTNVDMAGDGAGDRTRVEVVGTDLRITTSDGVNSPTIDLQGMSTDINSLAVTGSGDADTLHIIDSGSGLPTFPGQAIGAHSNAAYQSETAAPLAGFTLADVSINFIGGGGVDDLEIDFAGNAAVDVGYYSDNVGAANSGVVN